MAVVVFDSVARYRGHAPIINQRIVIGGDVITTVDGRRFADVDAMDAYLEDAKQVGDVVRVEYQRDGRDASVDLRLGERPQ